MDSDNITDNFKAVYKRYKRRDRPCNIEGVLDFSRSNLTLNGKVNEFKLHKPTHLPVFPGLKPFKEWKAYQLTDCPGFIVIPNPFTVKYQKYWIKRCLLDFSTKPNTTNLDAHLERPAQIWHKCVNEKNEPDLTKDSLLMKLRWATLGYQYEWNTKEYFSNRVQPFPDDLKHICSYIAATLGFSEYSSEAGIVNYYRMESTLMGHTDVSELDKAAPLISFSFGQSCIFLIGGPTKATEPVPLFLHSGDICLMTGEARLSYHAVPRIYPSDKLYFHSCFHDKEENIDGEDREIVMLKREINEGDAKMGSAENPFISEETKNVTCNKSNNCDNGRTDANCEQPENEDDLDNEEDPYSKSEKQRIFRENVKKLEYNGVEKIIETETVQGNICSVEELSELMDKVVKETNWDPFERYVSQSRINVNVRQVLKSGLELSPSPDVILPCKGKQI